jgi:hypothetical protein
MLSDFPLQAVIEQVPEQMAIVVKCLERNLFSDVVHSVRHLSLPLSLAEERL